MKKAIAFVTLSVLVSVGGGATCRRTPSRAPSPALRSVMDELVAKFDGLRAFSADTEIKLAEAIGLKGKTHGKGTYELSRAGGKTLVKFATDNFIYIDDSDQGPGRRTKTEEIIWQLFDGEHLYLLVQQHKYRKVTKAKYDPNRMLQVGGKELFRALQDENVLTLLADDVIGDRPTHVIQARPKDGQWTGKHWWDKQTGIRLQVIETAPDGSESFSLVLTKLNLAPEFPDDRFVMTIPEHYELIDETNPQAGSALPQKSGPATAP